MLARTRKLRIFLLLVVLFVVAMNTWLAKLRSTDWDSPLWVSVHPINADDSPNTSAYINSLGDDSFKGVEEFFSAEAEHYGLPEKQPVLFKLAPEVKSLPPPQPADNNLLQVVFWSLRLRYWAWKNDNFDGPANMQIFVVYHDPAITSRVAHSTALQKGLVGVVHAFADQRMQTDNHFILAHEFLHMVGASDKYAPQNNMPLYPTGYAEPDKQPLYPQRFAEAMGGRIPLSQHRSEIPRSLDEVLIGPATATEIKWLSPE